MTIYNHLYCRSTQQLTITAVEVTETPTAYQSNQRNLGFYQNAVNKNDLNKLINNGVSHCMLSTTENEIFFIELMINQCRHRINALSQEIEKRKAISIKR